MCDEIKMAELHELKCQLMACAKSEFAKGLENVNSEEAGEVIDMIKDLAQTEKYCREADYYRHVTEAMEDGDLSENGRWGYTPKRRKTPYKPYVDQKPYIDRYLDEGMDDRYGRAYNEYRDARRYYTETNSPIYRQEMDAHAAEHVGDTLATIREIWKNADPELRKRMKSDFTNLVNEMTV